MRRVCDCGPSPRVINLNCAVGRLVGGWGAETTPAITSSTSSPLHLSPFLHIYLVLTPLLYACLLTDLQIYSPSHNNLSSSLQNIAVQDMARTNSDSQGGLV